LVPRTVGITSVRRRPSTTSSDGGLIDGNYVDGVSSDSYIGGNPGVGYGTRTYGYPSGNGAPYEVTITNNRFQNVFYDLPNSNISVIRGPGINVHHNSVRMTGTATYTTGTFSCLFGVTAAYNNAFNNEIVAPSATPVRAVNPGGTIDYSALYSAGRPTSAHTTLAAATAAGVNTNGVWGKTSFTWDLHSDSTFPTAAQDIGKPFVLPLADIDAEPSDTTFAGKRDAGVQRCGKTGNLPACRFFDHSGTGSQG